MTAFDEQLSMIEAWVLFPPAWLRSTEPMFRHWDRLPARFREAMKGLKSDDLRRLRPDYVKGWLFGERHDEP